MTYCFRALWAVLFLLLCISADRADAGPVWPLSGTIDLSDGFGQYREGRFHTGIDIRTGGETGRPVVAPTAGWIHRVKMSYEGYGKGVYLKGDNGLMYVFGHLERLADKIRRPVRTAQLAAHRYYVDLTFPPDSIRFEAGERIGLSGMTGARGPHLHFEVRSPGNIPLNPLTHGFELKDKVAPAFRRLGLKMTDETSLLPNGRRKMFFDLKATGSRGLEVDSILYFNRPFGVLVDGYDMIRSGGMKQAIYRLTAFLDGQAIYRSDFDSLPFEEGGSVFFDYDYLEAVDDNKLVRRLFHKETDPYELGRPLDGFGGIIGADPELQPGLHKVRVVAEDVQGNKSSAAFSFIWGPKEGFVRLDSLQVLTDSIRRFHFTLRRAARNLDIDSVFILEEESHGWGRTEGTMSSIASGRFMFDVSKLRLPTRILRVMLADKSGGIIADSVFNGIDVSAPVKYEFRYEIVDDGLLVEVRSRQRFTAMPRVDLYRGEERIGSEKATTFLSRFKFAVLVPPREAYDEINIISVVMSDDPEVRGLPLQNLRIRQVGRDDRPVYSDDSTLIVHLGQENLYEPRFVELKRNRVMASGRLQLNSDNYQLFPAAFATRKPFEMELHLLSKNVYHDHSGICWLDEEKNEWVWLDNEFADNVLRAPSLGGGSFAAVFDLEKPQVVSLNIPVNRPLYDTEPTVRFMIGDTLSGIGDDRGITIKLDGEWLIPEYHPYTKVCIAQPEQPLEPGEHHLAIILTDRAGNTTEHYQKFSVRRRGRGR